MMKWLTAIITVVLVGVGSLFFYREPLIEAVSARYYTSSCDQPTTYKIGSVDSRFGLTTEEFSSYVSEAESIWESASGENVFAYDPEAKLKVNLVYDERQTLNNQVNQLEEKIEGNKQTLDSEIEQYKRESENLRKRIDDLNQRISHWNSQGGAPEDEYNKLIQEQNEVKEETARLNAKAESLNISTEEFNNQVGELNESINRFNEALAQKPEEGIYDPLKNSIDIYFVNNKDEMVHTLAHELGHALGVDHNNSKDSIMYPYSTQTITLSAEDIQSLKAVCEKKPFHENAVRNISLFIQDTIRAYTPVK